MEMSPNCNCCDVCEVFTDSLRDGSFSPFVAETGDWLADLEGFNTGTSDAQMIYPTVYEELSQFRSEVNTHDGGDETALYRIIWGWEDANNFWFGEVWSEEIVQVYGREKWWHLRVVQRVSGSDTLIEDMDHVRIVPSSETWLGYPIRVCFQDDVLQFIVEGPTNGSATIGFTVPFDPGTTFSGRFGFGTGISFFSTAAFKSWELTFFVGSGEPVDCACATNCCLGHVPKLLTLELAASDPVNCVVSGTYTLTLHNAFPDGGGQCIWSYRDEDICIHSQGGNPSIWAGNQSPHDPGDMIFPGKDIILGIPGGFLGPICVDDGWDDWVDLNVLSAVSVCTGISFTTKRFKVAA